MKTTEERLAFHRQQAKKYQEKFLLSAAAGSGGVGARVVKALRACESALQDEEVLGDPDAGYCEVLDSAISVLRARALKIGAETSKDVLAEELADAKVE